MNADAAQAPPLIEIRGLSKSYRRGEKSVPVILYS
jgi:hypothetical protein